MGGGGGGGWGGCYSISGVYVFNAFNMVFQKFHFDHTNEKVHLRILKKKF